MKNKLSTILFHAEEIVSAVFLSVTVSVVILNVILRYGFRSGLFWVEEVATTAFIWSVFIGAAAVYKRRMHIGIDLITRLFPESFQRVIAVLIDLMMVIINGYVCYLSVLMIQSNRLKTTPVLNIPAVYVNLAITVGFGLIMLHAMGFVYQDIKLIVQAGLSSDPPAETAAE
ncbi:TRAP transporter small permease [Alkalispirochaeta alkalica]|uniref:TRAP transporter small permease n=1 Tax=Alkalispirochaeta alkalica TaxID=46356 RepID=UPI00037A2AFF|nr:TRAP transporter small permease [Alkalispirochaeta alkalica]